MGIDELQGHFTDLMDLADRFCCLNEMALLLAIMYMGCVYRFFTWYQAGSIANAPLSIPSSHMASLQIPNDDLEFSLLLARASTQAYAQGGAQEYKQWKRQWSINQSEMDRVEQIRQELLKLYTPANKERYRPVDLRLLEKVRLLLAYYHYQRLILRTSPAGSQPRYQGNGKLFNLDIQIHSDSLNYGKDNIKAFVYTRPGNVENNSRCFKVGGIIAIPESWVSWLQKAPLVTNADLSVLITRFSRNSNSIQITSKFDTVAYAQRSFLGIPVQAMLRPFVTVQQDRHHGEVIVIEPYYGERGVIGPHEPAWEVSQYPAYQIGQVYMGTVHSFKDRHAIIRLDEHEGLLHCDKVWKDHTTRSLKNIFSIGMQIQVVIEAVQGQEIKLHARLDAYDPRKQLPVGSHIKGKIQQLYKSGRATVKIQTNIASCPTMIAWLTHEPNAHLYVGSEIEARIERYEVVDDRTCSLKMYLSRSH